MRAPTLSIIIPTLDEAARLPGLLDALAPARARGAELIVVDGGSSDGTAAVAQARDVPVVWSPPGRAKQLQAGAHASSGEALWFLHADSDVDPMCDQHIVWGLAESQRGWGRFAIRLAGRHPMLRVVARAMNLRSRLSGIATGDQGIFVTRALLERVGGIPQLPLMEDVELSSRLKAVCPPLCLSKRLTTSGRRWDEHGAFRTIALMWRLRFDYWRGIAPEDLAARYRGSDPSDRGARAA